MSERLWKAERESGDFRTIPIVHSGVLANLSRYASLSCKSLSNSGKSKMAEADLDGVIRSIAKKQHKTVMDAAKKRHAGLMGMAAKAKDKAAKARYKQLAKDTLLLAGAAARRLENTAEKCADSYARGIE